MSDTVHRLRRGGDPWEPSRRLRIATARDGRFTVVTVDGELDIVTARDLDAVLVERVAAGQTRLVVDLTRVGFLDSTALGVLVKALARVRQQDGTLDLIVADERVKRVFRLAGLDRVMALHASLSELELGAGSDLGH